LPSAGTGTGSKYFGKVTRATVHFRHEGQAFACTVKMRSGGLEPHAAECVDRDARRAFNMALEKVAKQLRREKRVLREDKPHRPGKEWR
jgi:ribosome-associated translation inhibitor RaiA